MFMAAITSHQSPLFRQAAAINKQYLSISQNDKPPTINPLLNSFKPHTAFPAAIEDRGFLIQI